jgi:hypothetical protein
MRNYLFVVAVFASVVSLSAQKQTLTDQDKADAVQFGVKAKGKLTGLLLQDSGQGWANALNAMNTGLNGYRNQSDTSTNTGFSVRVYTPKTWVEQLASNAAKEYRPFVVADITEEMLEPVLRVVVYPDKPRHLTGSGMSGTSSVEHVVLRDENKRLVVQPISKESFSDTASSALRDMTYEGIIAKFPLDAVRELRGAKGDKEFLIVVVGAGTKEKEFKVKEKHFDRLP